MDHFRCLFRWLEHDWPIFKIGRIRRKLFVPILNDIEPLSNERIRLYFCKFLFEILSELLQITSEQRYNKKALLVVEKEPTTL